MTVAIGDKAPDFSLPDQDGNPISLRQFRGNKVVLYFYPKDDTPGCTRESCDFRDNIARFKKKGVHVFGISKDNATSHRKFIEKYGLTFPLLSDENAEVCEAFGVIKEKSMFGKTSLGIQRSTFVINEEGVIESAWRNVKVDGHIEEVLNELN